MANYKLSFGAFDLPRTFRPVDEPLSASTGQTERLRAPGSVAQAARLQARSLTVMGEFTGIDLDAFLAVRDEVVSRCSDGPQDLFFGRDDRFYRGAQLVSSGVSYPEDGVLYGVYGVISLSFECADPEAFSVSAHAPALGAGGGTFLALGQSPALALPTWTITIGAGGSGPLRLANATTGEFCTVQKPGGAAFVGGEVITLDRDGAKGAVNGVSVSGLWDRKIPRLKCGQANTITLAPQGAATATAASLACSYRPRYR